ncbi:hypothetical protein [Stenotrophomonas phage BUCT608]|nr:hypothetical protein [Stenotrophomonas phage BUCT608]QYC97411.1 hypothetical protein [Stenotrophomonas phage BUCT608]
MANINILQNEAVKHAIIHAYVELMTEEEQARCQPGHIMDVELTIDGVEVDFTKLISSIYKRFEVGVQKEAQELALEMVNGDERLSRIRSILENVEWQIKDAVRDAFGAQWVASDDC